MAKKINYASLFTLRKDGRYVASYTDATGRHFLYDRDPERLYHKINDPKPECTFADVARAWYDAHRERVGYSTAELYKAPLSRLICRYCDRAPEDVTAADVEAYLSELAKQGYSRRSVQMHRDILNMIYNHAIVAGNATGNPCAAVSLPRNLPSSKRELPTDDELATIRRRTDHPFALFALLCLYAGLRRGEALSLRYEDIDRKASIIHVRRSVEFVGNNPHFKPPKTKSGIRDVPLLDPLAAILPAQKKGLIITMDGEDRALTKSSYRKRWQAYCRDLGIDITAHQLRHGFATILYEAGIPDKDAQELLGHSDIAVTRNIYTHIRQSRREETAARLNAFLAGNSDNNSDNKF